MDTYKLSDILTQDQYRDLAAIMLQERQARRQPHKAFMRYIGASPEILKKCEAKGLLPAFFAYQLEALLASKTQR